MKKNLLSFFPVILLVLLTLLNLGCSQDNQVKPTLSKLSGARNSADLQPSSADPVPPNNRGRIQIQGVDITVSPEPSWSWTREPNYTVSKSEAILQLDDLYDNLTTRQKQDRTEALQKAKAFIMAGPYTVVSAMRPRSFKNNNPRDPSIRIDIELISGTSFTD